MAVAAALPTLVAAIVALALGVPLARSAQRFLTSEQAVPRLAVITAPVVFAVVVALLVLRYGLQLGLVPFLALAALGVPLALVDIAEHRLPNRLVLAAGVVVGALLLVVAVVGGDPARLLGVLLGGAGLFVLYLVLAVVSRGQVGMGDVKLAAVIGGALGFLGWRVWLLGMLAGFLLNGVVSLVAVATRRSLK